MSKTDLLKSWVRSLTASVVAPFRRLPSTESLARVLAELQRRRITISDAKLTAAVGRVPEVQAATVSASGGCLRIELVAGDGQELSASLHPHAVRFAPRGAKELMLRVAPIEVAARALTRDVMAAVGTEIAMAIWGPLLPRQHRAQYSPYVHQDGDVLTLDLRDVPAVRSALSRGMGAALLDFIDVVSVHAETGRLVVQLRLMGIAG